MPTNRERRNEEDPVDPGDWNQYRMFVVKRLNSIQDEQHEIRDDLANYLATLNEIKTRVAVWSSIWGFMAAGVTILIDLFFRWRSGSGK